ncbi:right-handed parallel beta-helix repeat-containing protein [Synechococcus sp. Cruz CV-v-12]|uniref:right-handed parallel beta-helix repeat-containing protein n=1 Tax=Synechococcus sp. Cruz CV-v-12 TaxID=2823728 RepID=UPI0020CDBD2C|nr:right-handed parallel beta-helix repeat-containing protein [Synechococcus sp. Cruz CV-v-12]MCP9874372.1 right-handed parallel beta-helix repeat-containing protein [Synechococcus sp. Cruz CV-v-12]
MNTSICAATSFAALALLLAAAALAGPLTPPVGPVAPSGKTTQEVFDKVAAVESRIAINLANTPGDADSLFKISAPGSYYLTGNITGVASKHGIEIVASGVTLDLNGFDLVGVPAMGAFDGVSATAAGLANIAVLNGSVRSWGDKGVDLAAQVPATCRVEGVVASGNAGNGIAVGIGGAVTNCAVYLNTGAGISTNAGSTVSNCSAYDNIGNGISVSNGCTVTNCSARINNGVGISADRGCTVTDCSAYSNTGGGINAQSNSAILNCSTTLNSTSGIVAANGSTITACSSLQNVNIGISTGTGCTLSGCTASLNLNGIVTSTGCTLTGCTALQNTGNGIGVDSGTTVADCTAQSNILDGIVCTFACVIRGNTCSFNGSGGDGAGVHATSGGNRIEGNNCTSADRGIDVDGTGNIIIRNTCSGNSPNNWDIVAGNVCVVVQGVTGAAILGNTGGVAPGSTDPNANFSY